MVSEPEIAEVMRATEDSGQACETQVNLALQYGGKDNVTVAFVRCECCISRDNAASARSATVM